MLGLKKRHRRENSLVKTQRAAVTDGSDPGYRIRAKNAELTLCEEEPQLGHSEALDLLHPPHPYLWVFTALFSFSRVILSWGKGSARSVTCKRVDTSPIPRIPEKEVL